MSGAVSDATVLLDGDVEGLKMSHSWIATLQTSNGHRRVCSREGLADVLRDDILGGRVTLNTSVDVHARSTDGSWSRATVPFLGIARSDFKLRVLYEPVWGHAIAGLKWGALVGIGLKLAETFVRLLAVDGRVALMFMVALGLCFIPRVGMGIMIGASIIVSRFTRLNLFFAVGGAFLAGGILGCLPGMTIGGVVGMARRGGLHLAPDARPEGSDVAFKAVLLPLLGAVGVWALYALVVNPWLVGAR